MALEPWYGAIKGVLVPPLKLWFSWRFEGLEHIPREGPALVACNHISYFDPLAQGYFLVKAGRNPRFLAKSELFRNPLLRTVLNGARQIPVQRGTGDRGPVEAATAALRAGELVLVYPEGTVTTNPDFSPKRGKTGIARLTLATRVPVIPVAVWGSAPVWQRGGHRNLKYGRPIYVKAGPPLDFSQYEDRAQEPEVIRTVTDQVMAQLSLLVDDLRARYPKKRWA
ncbi:MAG TPA: lysophospholipid acyltransferase family protein [Actinomycetota bacterium]|nr:lysophospholipid acyltransferase family protein [Actinomycetota bacterium]